MPKSGDGGLRAGKLPPDLLAGLLARLTPGPDVVIGGAVGLDAAVIDFAPGSDRYLLAKTDPITFATDRIGDYAIHVNANDIVCMGGRPRWFLATALLPEGTAEAAVRGVFDQLESACHAIDVSLVGGHTEVTVGLDRPLVIGCMLGTVVSAELLLPRNVRAGDDLLLTHGAAIEGTAVLAREAATALRAAGLTDTEIAAAAELLDAPGISVLPAARALKGLEGLHALHDPTEGGIATAIRETATATASGFDIEVTRVPVLPETAKVCAALELDPLGLLASGALLAAVDPGGTEAALARLTEAGIPAARIGRLTSAAGPASEDSALPTFERDELARYLEGRSDAG
ncbi:MAG: AIR synthase related protein [Chloroflexota bacterium]|nr:AIR synthase related protein [Chloroflexota bacterium]MDP6756649.1 AIR synthase related protein [Chloroflexota bacterium]